MAARSIPDLEPEIHGRFFGRIKVGSSVLLHIGIVLALIAGHFLSHLFPHNMWGNQQAPGAIEATLVSSAPAIPLPQDQPPTPNVVATQTPSPAPAPPLPKIETIPPPDAIALARKLPPPKKKEPKKEVQPQRQTAPAPQQQYRASYGEQSATNMQRTVAPTQGPQNAVTVTGGSNGFNYPWYVSVIQRNVRQNWYTQEVTPGTPVGSKVSVTFSIARDGTPSDIRISQSSGYPTLDSSALRAVQRVENFSPLPSGYNKSSVSVEYTFTYDQSAH
ncbi:MAG: TonB family protein [Silvibacterium sp.]